MDTKTPKYWLPIETLCTISTFLSADLRALYCFALSSTKILRTIWKHQTHLRLTTAQLPRVIPALVAPEQIRSLTILTKASKMYIKGVSPDESTYHVLRTILPRAKNLRSLAIKPQNGHVEPRYDEAATAQFILLMLLVEAPLERLSWRMSSFSAPTEPITLFREFKFRNSLKKLCLHIGWKISSFEDAALLGEFFPNLEFLHFPSAQFDPSYIGGITRTAKRIQEIKFNPSDQKLFPRWKTIVSGADGDWNSSPTTNERIKISTNWMSEIFWRIYRAGLISLLTSSFGSLFEMGLRLCFSTHPFTYTDMGKYQFKNGTHSALAAIILGPCGQYADSIVSKVDAGELIPILKRINASDVDLSATTRKIFPQLSGFPTGSSLIFNVNPIHAAIVSHKPVILKILLSYNPRVDLKLLAGGSINLFHLAICACPSDKALLSCFKTLLERRQEFGIFDSQLSEENSVAYTPLEMCLQSQRYESALFLSKSGMRLFPRARRSLLAPATLLNATFNRPPPVNAEAVAEFLLKENYDRPPQDRLMNDFFFDKLSMSLLARLALGSSTELFEFFLKRAAQEQKDLAFYDICSCPAKYQPKRIEQSAPNSKTRAVSHDCLLLDAGANPMVFFSGRNTQSLEPMNSLMMACTNASVERIDLLLERFGPRIIALKHTSGRFAAQYAAGSRELIKLRPDIVERLVDFPEFHARPYAIDDVLTSLDVFYVTSDKSSGEQSAALRVRRNIKRMRKLKYPQQPKKTE